MIKHRDDDKWMFFLNQKEQFEFQVEGGNRYLVTGIIVEAKCFTLWDVLPESPHGPMPVPGAGVRTAHEFRKLEEVPQMSAKIADAIRKYTEQLQTEAGAQS